VAVQLQIWSPELPDPLPRISISGDDKEQKTMATLAQDG
jgi:hypothetical protein